MAVGRDTGPTPARGAVRRHLVADHEGTMAFG